MQLFSCTAKLRVEFIMLINVKMPTIVGIFTFISLINTILRVIKQESGHEKFYYLGACLAAKTS